MNSVESSRLASSQISYLKFEILIRKIDYLTVSEIAIILNGERRDIVGEVDLDTLVIDLELPSKRLAVELNGNVVRRADWPKTTVSNGDRIEVVHFVGGG